MTTAEYGDHPPLNRLSGIFNRHGLSILEQMKRKLLEESHLQADETPVTVQLDDQRGTRQGYIWAYG